MSSIEIVEFYNEKLLKGYDLSEREQRELDAHIYATSRTCEFIS